ARHGLLECGLNVRNRALGRFESRPSRGDASEVGVIITVLGLGPYGRALGTIGSPEELGGGVRFPFRLDQERGPQKIIVSGIPRSQVRRAEKRLRPRRAPGLRLDPRLLVDL